MAATQTRGAPADRASPRLLRTRRAELLALGIGVLGAVSASTLARRAGALNRPTEDELRRLVTGELDSRASCAELTAEIEDGVVVLRGQVPDQEALSQAAEALLAIRGVRAVRALARTTRAAGND